MKTLWDVSIISSNDFDKFGKELDAALRLGYGPMGPAQACIMSDTSILYTITLKKKHQDANETQPT